MRGDNLVLWQTAVAVVGLAVLPVKFDVFVAGGHLGEGFVAVLAGVRSQSVVPVRVLVQRLLARERFAAQVADERPFTCVNALVPLVVSFGEELCETDGTRVLADTFVSLSVQPQLRLLSEALAAQVTEVRLLVHVHRHVSL